MIDTTDQIDLTTLETRPVEAIDDTVKLARATVKPPAAPQFHAPEPQRSTLADRFLAELDGCQSPDERRALVWRFAGRIAEAIWQAVEAREAKR